MMESQSHVISEGTFCIFLHNYLFIFCLDNSHQLLPINWGKSLKQKLPITSWLPHYTFPTLLQDILAGFTVGLTEIPQAIAFAVIAGI